MSGMSVWHKLVQRNVGRPVVILATETKLMGREAADMFAMETVQMKGWRATDLSGNGYLRSATPYSEGCLVVSDAS
ncbi:hypothetical protein ACLOJK_009138 [Asimina triloba]